LEVEQVGLPMLEMFLVAQVDQMDHLAVRQELEELEVVAVELNLVLLLVLQAVLVKLNIDF
jgi:hypothetical protein